MFEWCEFICYKYIMPMIKPTTLKKLVLFVYDEISDPEERDEMAQAIREDKELHKKYMELAGMRKKIDNSFSSPPDEIVNNILNYAKALDAPEKKNRKKRGL
jgi:hypothetical protein